MNLDDVPYDDLVDFTKKYKDGRNSRQLFPGQRGSQAATRQMVKYAAVKMAARQARGNGNIEHALYFESMCDRIYNQLPGFAKW